MRESVLLVHAAVTLFMTGVIWTIQLVHYPSFGFAGPERFSAFHRAHLERITLVVAPAMLLELAASLAVAFFTNGAARWVGLGLLASIWLSTALVQVAQHEALGRGYDAGVIDALVRGNWLRTVAWTLRAAVALALLRR